MLSAYKGSLILILLTAQALSMEDSFLKPVEDYLNLGEKQKQIDLEINKIENWIKEKQKDLRENKELFEKRDPYYPEAIEKEIKNKKRIIKRLREEKCQILFQKQKISNLYKG